MHTNQIKVRAVVFQDSGAWIAQCLDYDICAQGPDPETVRRRFIATLEADLSESMQRNGEPFSGIGPAPEWVTEKWTGEESPFMSNGTLPVSNRQPLAYELALCA